MTELINTTSSVMIKYISACPLPLAFERIIECRILHEQKFQRPVLDIGCGEGLFASILFKEKIDTGIDPNEVELSRAKSLNAYNELIKCYGNKIPKKDGKYNTIFSNSVIEHIPDIEPVLKEAYRLLSPGGKMYITVPTDRFEEYTTINQILTFFGLNSLSLKYRKFFNKFWNHFHAYKPIKWAEICNKIGFDVVEVKTYGSKTNCIINDFLVPASLLEFVTKKLLNRWTILPAIRVIFLSPFIVFGHFLLRRADKAPNGGLVFISLRKPI